MDLQEAKVNDKPTKALAWTNLGLLAVTNFLVYATWYKVVFATVDTMFFGGLITVILFLASVYYLILLNWGVRLLKNVDDSDKKIMRQSFILLVMNIAPITTIYLLTT
ncbi:MAG TPA: hypothetical protein VK835_08400 [Bacteroidia bacterium]|jgi:hypothetical protein|nr:hypothetical protein [Bacteroidia bacterium]